MKKVWLFSGLILAVTSCKKPENRTCFKSWGEETTRMIPLAAFHELELKEHMTFVMVQDSTNSLVVKAGKNMVNLVEADVDENGVLKIENKSKCRFLRDKKKNVVVEIHFTTIDKMTYGGTETLTTQGTVVLDQFQLLIRDGAGPVNMAMNANWVDADITNGYGDYTFTGQTHYARISAKSNGFCDVTGLQVTDSMFVVSETVAPMKINGNNVLVRGYLKGSGNIYYTGTPLSVQVVKTGSGNILPM